MPTSILDGGRMKARSRSRLSTSRVCEPALAGLFSVLAFACTGDACGRGAAPGAGQARPVASVPMPSASAASAPAHVPPFGPAALGEPRSFHFVVLLGGKPNAVMPLETADEEASPGWLPPGAKVDLGSMVRPSCRDEVGAALVDEEKLPSALRLRGVRLDVYADDKLVCEGKLGATRLGALGAGEPGSDSSALRHSTSRQLFFEIDLPPDCSGRLESEETHVAWARDASLPKPVIVGRAERAVSLGVQRDVRSAVRPVRATPAFIQSQRLSDFERAKFGHPSLLLEQLDDSWESSAHWTRFLWKGEERAYFAVVNDCPPPGVAVGFDFHVNARGAFEVLPGLDRHSPPRGDDLVSPTVLADIDADGSLESIEVRRTSYRLVAFEPPDPPSHYMPTHALFVVDHCD